MNRVLLVLGAAGVVAAGAVWWRWERPAMESVPAVHTDATARKYQCPMHPQIVSDRPGNCPICGMRLALVDEHPAAPSAVTGGVPGRAPFTLSAARQQLIGVRRATVQPRPLAVQLRAIGTVAYDPELFQAIVEYRQAIRAKTELAQSSLPEAQTGADGLARAAAVKLRQKGVSEAQLASVARGDTDPLNLLLPGKSVWIYAQVYEYELGLVRPGQTMTITAPSLPGRRFSARVASIDPILDASTRTARVRALVATPQADLRPESFVDVVIEVPLGTHLAVPDDAVLDTGLHRIVFVVRGEGEFEPRDVELGREAAGYSQVLSGLTAGEQVVVGANFLIDSESRFRAAVRAFEGAAPPPNAEHRH